MALVPLMSCLFTVHLDGNLRADQGAGRTARAPVLVIKLGNKITLKIELIGLRKGFPGAKSRTEQASLAQFLVNGN